MTASMRTSWMPALQPVERGVTSAGPDQLVMRAVLDQAATIDA